MSRADLLALTPESIAALANLGLVKRAQREIETGKGPTLTEAAGTVTGSFADGVVTTIAPGCAFTDAECTCGASSVCRHRVAVALAYASRGGLGGEDWSPASFSEDDFPARLRKRADALVVPGLQVELEARTAKLPTSSVRFLVPRELAYAQCDCKSAGLCEHVVVAVRAFREAASRGLAVPCAIELGTPAAVTHDDGSLAELVHHVLATGVANMPVDDARFERVLTTLQREGLVWPHVLASEVQALLAAYRSRSARYRTGELVFALASIAARTRAADRGELSARHLLGRDVAGETALDHVRLVSLGARVVADGESRTVSIYLADAASGAVSTLERGFDGARELAGRSLAPGVKLGALACGQLVTRSARRRANRALALAARGAESTVASSTGAWEALPRELVVRDRASLAARLARRPPRLLRPPVLAEGMVVLALEEGAVREVAYRPSDEELVAEVLGIAIVRHHTRATPAALDVVARALLSRPRFIAGEASVGPYGITIDPTAIVTDRVVVPDLESEPPFLSTLPRLVPRARTELALDSVQTLLEEALHDGLAHLRGGFGDRAQRTANAAAAHGLVGLERRILALKTPEGWLDLAIRTELTREPITE